MWLLVVALGAACVSACNALSGVGGFDMVRDADLEAARSDAGEVPNDPSTVIDDPGTNPDVDASASPPGDPQDGSPPVGDDAAEPGDPSTPSTVTKRVFVTAAKVTGDFGGIAKADSMCQQAATNGGLGGDWVAWLSDSSTSAIDRIEHDGPYALLDGTPVVSKKADLTSGTIQNPIGITENMGPVSGGENWVWTGTVASGSKSSYTCSTWSTTSALTFGVVGNFGRTNRQWTEQGSPGLGFPAYGCQTVGHIYCFER